MLYKSKKYSWSEEEKHLKKVNKEMSDMWNKC